MEELSRKCPKIDRLDTGSGSRSNRRPPFGRFNLIGFHSTASFADFSIQSTRVTLEPMVPKLGLRCLQAVLAKTFKETKFFKFHTVRTVY